MGLSGEIMDDPFKRKINNASAKQTKFRKMQGQKPEALHKTEAL